MKTHLQTYTQYLTAKGNPELAESVAFTAEKLGRERLKSFSYMSHEIGLLFGNVQSGKTGQMFGIICKAADMGFPVFLVLTTDNIVLQQQTLERVRTDLQGFCICGENDSGKFIENALVQDTIIILKKNARILRLWANIFSTTGFMKGNPLVILDDEADAASLNTFVNKNKQSSINKHLNTIKNGSSSSLYFQITGTPQAILLQTVFSGWHPYFTYYFEPGKSYLGGEFFFPKSGRPNCIEYIDEIDDPLKSAIIHHIAVSSQILGTGGKVCNFMIHPGVRQSEHQKFCQEVKRILAEIKSLSKSDFDKIMMNAYKDLAPEKSDKLLLSDFLDLAEAQIQKEQIKTIIMNGLFDVENTEYSIGSNIIIGGNTLGRGVTFPKLETIYYTRTAKKPQADTMWQHSRMFGYDRDPGMMKVYITRELYKLFTDINSTNESIIAQLQSGLDEIKIWYPRGLNPTRPGVLDKKHVDAVSGGTNYYPDDPDNCSFTDIDKLMSPFTGQEAYSANLRLIKEILNHIVPSQDFKYEAFMAILDMMTAETPPKQGVIIARRGRNVTQGTGALLSPNDWQLGESYKDRVVLTMYRIDEAKGWKHSPIWVPNIKFPEGMVYYDVDDKLSRSD